MVGRNKIYLSLSLNGMKVKEKDLQGFKCHIVVTIIHESAHWMIRQFVIQNYLGSSPRGISDEVKMEAGFDMEAIIFGNPITDYKACSDPILSLKSWQQGPLLSHEEIAVVGGNRLNQYKIVRHVHQI
jgi:hypothetical protein